MRLFDVFMVWELFHLQVPEQFRILLRRVPTQSVQVLGRVTVQFVFRCFGFVISYDVFGIRWFSRFLDGRAISAVFARVEFFRKLSCWFSLCLQDFFCLVPEYVLATLCFSIASCRTMLRVLLFWRYKVDAKLSCVCVCVFVEVLFHVECCFIIVVAFCEVTRHYGLVRGLNCNHPCGSVAGGNVGAVLPRFFLHRDMYLYVG